MNINYFQDSYFNMPPKLFNKMLRLFALLKLKSKNIIEVIAILADNKKYSFSKSNFENNHKPATIPALIKKGNQKIFKNWKKEQSSATFINI